MYEKAVSGNAGKTDSSKGTTNKHTHTMMVDAFEDFDTGAEDHFFFSQVVEKFSNLPVIWMLIYSESTIKIILNKSIVNNIQKFLNLITLHCNVGSRKVEHTADLKR